MLHLSIVTPKPVPVLPDDEAAPFLRFAGSCTHALVVGVHPLPLICGMIQRGCRAAASIRPGEKPDDDSYDLLLAPRAGDFPSLDHIVRLASRALVRDGRLLVVTPDAGTAAMLDRRLQLNGFILSASIPHRPHGLLLCFDRRGPRP